MTYEVGDNKDVIMVIYVPMAKREQKPVYINNDIFNGTFRRNYEGDYHCTRLQVKTMLRDQTERTMDMEVLDKVPMEDLNYDTIHGYRNSHRSLKEGHPFERLSDHEYLRSIGAAAGIRTRVKGLGSHRHNHWTTAACYIRKHLTYFRLRFEGPLFFYIPSTFKGTQGPVV